ncbi:hypothetical protein SAMN04487944_1295 [Gracilibacillus ureilyticus]|uniref:Uncharacterized protein n=1 Tax=Gracilibacillus ureilyticus TaxID=531814 RepID=A0A1H9VWS6_9BACI|nr:hypothetical protein [Gracilibacillus ureilyticus]SES26072.1 hypothetical protein SAMN04487944_1295 [Gracilibacillus ureilyticus]
MSENKKVIYVKDLVIKADNVRIEPSRSQRPDPLFGPRKQTLGEAEEREHRHEELEDIADDRKDHHHDKENDRDDDRKPFSWL